MEKIYDELGQRLKTENVAVLLGLNEKTVRKHFKELGGMKVGRQYIFFERRIINAIQERTEMDWSDTEGREETGEGLHKQEGCARLGNQDEKFIRRRLVSDDKHSLFG